MRQESAETVIDPETETQVQTKNVVAVSAFRVCGVTSVRGSIYI